MSNLKSIRMKMVFAVLLVVTMCLPSNVVKAAKLGPTCTMQMVQETLTGVNGEAIAVMSYVKPVLTGESEAIKKINQSIDNDCTKAFNEHKDDLFTYAQGDYDSGRTFEENYYCTYDSVVTYNANNIISFKVTWSWYAGGVSNKSSYGLTYNIATGEKLGLNDVVQGSSSNIKKKLVTATKKYLKNLSENKISSDELQNAIDVINKYKVSEYKYYLKNNKAYVCFDEYELVGNYYGGNIVGITMKDFNTK